MSLVLDFQAPLFGFYLLVFLLDGLLFPGSMSTSSHNIKEKHIDSVVGEILQYTHTDSTDILLFFMSAKLFLLLLEICLEINLSGHSRFRNKKRSANIIYLVKTCFFNLKENMRYFNYDFILS